MHNSAYKTGKLFFDTYCNFGWFKVVEIGSQNVNGTLRDHKTPNVSEYIGVDFANGSGVDIVLQDLYKYPFEDNSVDAIVSSSCYEHSELFWLTFLEGMRVLRPTGVMYINAPSSWMTYHRFPVDCWRFYPDSAKALETWARYNKYNSMVMESFITPPLSDEDVCDWVGVFIKDAKYSFLYNNRMIDELAPYQGYFNGFRFPENDKFPDGWNKPSAEYHQAVKKNIALDRPNMVY